jgi:hypothetical protein
MKNNQGSKKHNSEKVPEKKHLPTSQKKKKKKKKTTTRQKIREKGWAKVFFTLKYAPKIHRKRASDVRQWTPVRRKRPQKPENARNSGRKHRKSAIQRRK